MKTRIVKIGNSRGIRIPKPLLDQAGLTEDVIITVKGNRLVISPVQTAREGWADAFRLMSENGDDAPIDELSTTTSNWDDEEWEW